MKDYYEILGVQRAASQAAIRDAYRRLAKLYHPDVNASPDSEQIFKEINEAYEILGDPEQRAQYDQPSYTYVFDQTPQQPKSPAHRDPAYRRPRAPKQAGESEAQRLRRLKLEHRKWFLGLCVAGLCFSILLGIDVVLPATTVQDTIVSVKFYQGSRRTASRYEIITYKGSVFRAYHSPNFNWDDDSAIELSISPMLSKVLEVRVSGTSEFVWVALFYSTLSFFPISLFLASLIGVLGRRNIDLLVNCGTIALVVGLISLYVY